MILHGHGWRLRTLKRSENIIRWLRKISQHGKALWVLGFNSWSTGNNHQYHFRKHVLIKLGASILWSNNLQHANVALHHLDAAAWVALWSNMVAVPAASVKSCHKTHKTTWIKQMRDAPNINHGILAYFGYMYVCTYIYIYTRFLDKQYQTVTKSCKFMERFKQSQATFSPPAFAFFWQLSYAESNLSFQSTNANVTCCMQYPCSCTTRSSFIVHGEWYSKTLMDPCGGLYIYIYIWDIYIYIY